MQVESVHQSFLIPPERTPGRTGLSLRLCTQLQNGTRSDVVGQPVLSNTDAVLHRMEASLLHGFFKWQAIPPILLGEAARPHARKPVCHPTMKALWHLEHSGSSDPCFAAAKQHRLRHSLAKHAACSWISSVSCEDTRHPCPILLRLPQVVMCRWPILVKHRQRAKAPEQ